MSKNYDVIVVGAGAGGLTSAVGLAKAGKTVLLIEKDKLGGECTHAGCIPSKALLHYAKRYSEGVAVAGKTDRSETYRHNALNYVRQKISVVAANETVEHFARQGITVIEGEATFVDKKSVRVKDKVYHFRQAIIATGSAPRTLEVPGLQPHELLTNQNLFELLSLPERVLIIGGGPIGLEMGQALAYLGTEVTIVDNSPTFARHEDEAIRPILKKKFQDLGITLLNNATVKHCANGVAQIINTDKEASLPTTVSYDQVLVAIGRVPSLPAGLENAGVVTTKEGITVNQNWQTTNRSIYALGDVAARLKFTHAADDAARQVVAHIISHRLLSVKEKLIPRVTYTNPEMGQVGLSWEEAIAEYGESNLFRIEIPLTNNDRALTETATEGVLVIIAKRLSGKIIGAHLIAPRGGELIATITLAMENNISLYRLRNTVFPYPTYSLLLKRAGDYFLSTQISTLKADLYRLALRQLPKITAVLIWLYLLIVLNDYRATYGLTVTELALRLFEFITATAWAPLLYVIAYTLRPLIFFPGTLLTILSGIFFGLWGIPLTIAGAALSSILAYGVGHFFSTSLSTLTNTLKNWTTPLRTHPFLTILTMRLTFFPFDLVAYGSGILRVRFIPFLLATIVGTILGITTFVSLGASLSLDEFIKTGITTDAIDSKFILLSFVLFATSFLISKMLQRKAG